MPVSPGGAPGCARAPANVTPDGLLPAVYGSKKAILGALSRGLSDGVAYAWTALPDIGGTQGVLEGPRAFVEKRKPRFLGR